MCRSTDFRGLVSRERSGYLNIRAFHFNLTAHSDDHALPAALTLVYLPSSNGNNLEINGVTILPESRAMLSLHRVRSAEAAFVSTDRVRTVSGVRFEIYLKDRRVVQGILLCEEREWKMKCRCTLASELIGASAAEVYVETECSSKMKELVAMQRKPKRACLLAGIPEVIECEGEIEMDGCDCKEGVMDHDDDPWVNELETGLAGVRRAVEVGIWAASLGIGLLVSAASSRAFSRR